MSSNPAASKASGPAPCCSAEPFPQDIGASRILVVDDCRMLCRLISRALQGTGAIVKCCGNGRDAVNLVVAAMALDMPFDIVLMDAVMPELNGIDATYEIRKQGYRGKILMLTAADQRYDLAYALSAGADDWLAKPFTPAKLAETIRTLCTAA